MLSTRFKLIPLSLASPKTICNFETASGLLAVAGRKGKRPPLTFQEDHHGGRRYDDDRNGYKDGDGISRKIAWHLASDINIVAFFRVLMVAIGGVLVFLLSYVWHDVTGKIASSILTSRLTNERIDQTNIQMNQVQSDLAVMRSQLDDIRANRPR